MDTSILDTIKKMLGIAPEYDAFDSEIVVYINSVMMNLQQLGVGPTAGFTITGSTETWSDFLPSDVMIEAVKSYIFIFVKMMFDSYSSNSYVMEVMNKQKEELEWRLREQAEYYPGDGSRLGYYQALDKSEESKSDELSGVGPFNEEASDDDP